MDTHNHACFVPPNPKVEALLRDVVFPQTPRASTTAPYFLPPTFLPVLQPR
jgi:hypothetical protein